MKRKLLVLAVLITATTNNAFAVLIFEGFGGFKEGSAVGFDNTSADPLRYHGCADGVCTSFSWGEPYTPPGGTPQSPFGGQSGASINTGIDTTKVVLTPEQNKVVHNPNILDEISIAGFLTHWNRIIFTDGFVGNVDVEYRFVISDDLGDSVSFARVFDLQFAETVNDPLLCDPDPNPSGSNEPCDDRFLFFGDRTFTFMLSGATYEMEIVGFCADPHRSSCTDGLLYSAEKGETVGYVLEVKRVPVPGVLALISAGLIGLGAARQRHRNNMDFRRANNDGHRSC